MAKSYSIEVYNCTELNVRKSASKTSKSIGTVKVGYKGTATKVSDGWYYVSAKGGWLSGKFLKVNGKAASAPPAKKKLTAEQKAVAKVKSEYKSKINAAKKKLTQFRALRDKAEQDIKKVSKDLHATDLALLPKTYKLHVEDDRDWMKASYVKKRINPYSVKAKGVVTDAFSTDIMHATIKGHLVDGAGKFNIYGGSKKDLIDIAGESAEGEFQEPTIKDFYASEAEATEESKVESTANVARASGVRTMSVTPARYETGTARPTYDGKYVDYTGAKGSMTKTGLVDQASSFIGVEDKGSEDSLSADFELYTLLRNIDYLDANSYDRTFTEMNRFRLPFIGSSLSKAKAYVFFTRPTLHLFNSNGLRNEIADNAVLSHLYEQNPLLLKSLSSKLSENHGFNPFLSNAAQSMEIADEVMKTIEHGETYTGWKQVYARNTNESNSANQFSVQYTEDKDLNIYNIHKAWIEYMNCVMRGDITSTRYAIVNKVLDYSCAVYYFMCAADGETILFWNKYTGVFPINTPASAFSWSADTPITNPKLTVNYMYAMREQMNTKALAEFNYLSHGEEFGAFADIYNSSGYAMHNSTMVGMPFVLFEKNSNGGKPKFKLKFRPN